MVFYCGIGSGTGNGNGNGKGYGMVWYAVVCVSTCVCTSCHVVLQRSGV